MEVRSFFQFTMKIRRPRSGLGLAKFRLIPNGPTAKQAAEKLKFLSFRGTLRAEESLILLTLEPREIPHFVRNDKNVRFSAAPKAGLLSNSYVTARSRDPQNFPLLNSVLPVLWSIHCGSRLQPRHHRGKETWALAPVA
jgi:hypothetical protein